MICPKTQFRKLGNRKEYEVISSQWKTLLVRELQTWGSTKLLMQEPCSSCEWVPAKDKMYQELHTFYKMVKMIEMSYIIFFVAKWYYWMKIHNCIITHSEFDFSPYSAFLALDAHFVLVYFEYISHWSFLDCTLFIPDVPTACLQAVQ